MKSAKKALKSILNDSRVTDEELQTEIVEVDYSICAPSLIAVMTRRTKQYSHRNISL
jgi:hypothetical protein